MVLKMRIKREMVGEEEEMGRIDKGVRRIQLKVKVGQIGGVVKRKVCH